MSYKEKCYIYFFGGFYKEYSFLVFWDDLNVRDKVSGFFGLFLVL